MKEKRKFFKHKVSFTVLSEDSDINDLNLSSIVREMDTGDLVGGNVKIKTTKQSSKKIAEELLSLGSSPSFFNIED